MSKLSVKNVTKEYPTRTEPVQVLRGVSFSMDAGENLSIVGPSGCGKSTLLAILGALDEPTSGSISLDDKNPFTLNPTQLAEFRNLQIGFVFQDHHLLPQCSVLENVLIPTLATGASSSEDIERARMLIDRTGLTSRIEHRPAELSGGERQRVAIARALIRQPQLLLADEPTGNLDKTTAHEISELLLEIQKDQAMMLILVTHSQELAKLLSRCVELDNGKLIEL